MANLQKKQIRKTFTTENSLVCETMEPVVHIDALIEKDDDGISFVIEKTSYGVVINGIEVDITDAVKSTMAKKENIYKARTLLYQVRDEVSALDLYEELKSEEQIPDENHTNAYAR